MRDKFNVLPFMVFMPIRSSLISEILLSLYRTTRISMIAFQIEEMNSIH